MKNLFVFIFNSLFDKFAELMSNLVDGSMLKISDSDLATANQIFEYLALIGTGLTIIFFIAELNRRWAFEGGDISIKSFGAPFCKFVAALIILGFSATIIGHVCGINNAFIDKGASLSSATGIPIDSTTSAGTGSGLAYKPGKTTYTYYDPNAATTDPPGEKVYDALNRGGATSFFGLLFCILALIIAVLLSFAIGFAFTYKAFLYRIEFVFRVAFSSIACADIYSGQNSGTVRWLKSFLGFGLYGLAFVIIPGVVCGLTGKDFVEMYKALDDTATTYSIVDLFKFFGLLVLSPLISFGLLGTVKQLTKEAVG